MLGGLIKLIVKAMAIKPKDTYEPKFDGQWVNNGNDHNEKWIWKEFNEDRSIRYINIFKSKDGHRVIVSNESSPYATDCMECIGRRETEIALQLLSSNYGSTGKVTIDNPDFE